MRFTIILLTLSGPADVAPDVLGKQTVGVTTIVWRDAARSNRLLRTEIWYPATAAAGAALGDGAIAAAPARSRREAECAKVRSPLIVFSHGSRASRLQSTVLTEFLASHGYIVAACDHLGNTVFDDNDNKYQTALDRPTDVSFVIDRMLEANLAEDHRFAGRLDPTKIAALGHSFGGYTVLVLAGAVVDGKAAAARFDRPLDKPNFRQPDRRIRAVVAYAPPGPPVFRADGLSEVTIPTFVWGGTNDNILEYEQQRRVFEGLGGPAYLGGLIGGTHFSFNDAGFVGLVRLFSKKKIDERIDRARADALVKSLTLAFLDRHLVGADRWSGTFREYKGELEFRQRKP